MLVYREFVLVNTNLDSTRLYVEDHVHKSRVFCSLHLVRPQLNEAPVEKGTTRSNLCEFEAAVANFARLNALIRPCNICCKLVRASMCLRHSTYRPRYLRRYSQSLLLWVVMLEKEKHQEGVSRRES